LLANLKILWPTSWIGLAGQRASVLDCGSPLPLFTRSIGDAGLPQSKTSRNFSGALTKHGHGFIKNALKINTGAGKQKAPSGLAGRGVRFQI
jgi:hypothetical protein